MSSYAPRTAVREKLVLQVGRPVTIALEYSTGKLVSSNIPGAPDQVYYTLTDDRGWYADLAAAELIEKLDLVSREPFTIEKLGAGRFEVQRTGQYPTEPIANGARVQPQRAAARTGECGRAAENDRPVGGTPTAANSRPEYSSGAQTQPPTTSAQPATKLEQALKTAILASANAEKYGAEIGYTVRFTPEAIKCMAISVLIGMEQGGRR
jgi:hypothetical protein